MSKNLIITAEPLAERFLKLCKIRTQEARALGQPNPVLDVALRDDNKIQIVMRNGMRWIVERNGRRV